MQGIMSRTGSFPLHVPLRLLECIEENSVVLDPFCGKGTSLLAARQLGHRAYGSDVAPEAVVSSSVRITNTSLDTVLNYLESMEPSQLDCSGVPREVSVFFDPGVLGQLLGFRSALLQRVNIQEPDPDHPATAILAALLGILHGRSAVSLSIPSAHAYSMSSGYVSRYATAKGLVAPVRDVKSCLREKLTKCLSIPLPRRGVGSVRLGSALRLQEVYPDLVGGVDVLLTSPPYLNAQTYAKDNWLRLWLLGFEYRTIQHDYIETGSVAKYSSTMTAVFEQVHAMLRPGGLLICIAGDVRIRGKSLASEAPVLRTGDMLAGLCSTLGGRFTLEMADQQSIPSWARYFHSLSGTNGHSASPLVERVFAARKV